MPPKRKSSDNADAQPKRSKTGGETPEKKGSRWSNVSGSANIYESYKRITSDAPDTYAWKCECKAPFENDDEDDEPESKEEDEDKMKDTCDDGKTCLCEKSAAEYPDHPWIFTFAGQQKFLTSMIQLSLRNPDCFGMYVYNDSYGWGIMEVVENLLVDFEEAEGNWKEQWAMCEAIALFWLRGDPTPLYMVDDGDHVNQLADLIGAMFLSMLATLGRNGLLKEESEVKNLGMIMGLYIRIGFDDTLDFDNLSARVFAYATKNNIKLGGLKKLQSRVDDLQAEVDKITLPASEAKNNDPWDWKKLLNSYEGYSGDIPVYAIKPNKMGGDGCDITTWSSAKRKKHSFDNKDPLGKKEMDAIKQGMVMQLA
ncbi:hypothetical protein N7474_007425 [Penicillium riverlandense]|uniref:uncharacterized protein n=1 Tax=Penicillium riverlandense TaxID=1903569 RepID=UPI002546D04C|nr:uncharacterized protein N7474_007425 [Penicillium riverlandense]KAJ5815648.1 hypothetical protein N7474_007425 [Penicillium riverlandense]